MYGHHARLVFVLAERRRSHSPPYCMKVVQSSWPCRTRTEMPRIQESIMALRLSWTGFGVAKTLLITWKRLPEILETITPTGKKDDFSWAATNASMKLASP